MKNLKFKLNHKLPNYFESRTICRKDSSFRIRKSSGDRSKERVLISCFLLVTWSTTVLGAEENDQSFTLDGQLFQAGTTRELIDSSVSIVTQILSPNKTCVLYQETQSGIDLSTTRGYFNIKIGSALGNSKRTASVDPGNTMAAIFQNSSDIPAFSAPGQSCPGNSYTPSPGDSRYFRITVIPASGLADTLSPDFAINSVPTSLVAETIQGVGKDLLIQSDGSVSFIANQSLGGHKLTNVGAPTAATDAATKSYVDSAVAGGGGGGSANSILKDGTIAFTGDQSMGSHKLTNVTDPSGAQDAATKNYVDTGLSSKQTSLGFSPVNKAGDSMSGLLILSGDPAAQLGAATKQYVDSSTSTAAANYILKNGTVAFTGDQSMGSHKLTNVTDPTSAQDAATKAYVDGSLAGKQASLGFTPMNVAGDTMTGPLILPSNGMTVGTSQLVVAGGKVGIGTTAPGALLDLNSTTSGLLIPRMTTTQKMAISTPATGLQVYDTDTNQLNYYNGTVWQALGVSGAGISSLTAGTGLTGGTITTSGTIGLGTELAGLNGLASTGFMKRTGAGAYTTATSVSLTADVSGVLALANGGSNANLTAVNGGAVYSTGTALAITAAGTSGQVLTSNGASAPTWAAVNDSTKVIKAGDTMTGLLVLSADPSASLGAATKQYVDSGLSSKQNSLSYTPLNIAGDTMTGPLNLATNGLIVGTSQLVVTGGKIGVGTTNPTEPLHVEGTLGVHSGSLKLFPTNDTQILLNHSSSGWGFLGNPSVGIWSLGYTNSGTTTLDHPVLNWTNSGKVGIGTTAPSAIFDVSSTTSGVLIPRLTTTQRDAISTPANGLQVYNTTTNQLNYYNGTAWQALSSGGSGVTSLTAGTGLTGGTITSSGTIGLDTELAGLNGLSSTGFMKRTGAGAYSTSSSVSLTADVSGVLPLANGGSNANLTAVNGGAVYSTGTALAITAAGTSGQVLTSNGASAPTWAAVSDSTKVIKAGDTMSGLLVLSADPSATLGAATKQYVDSVASTEAANYIFKNGTVAFTGDQSMGSHKLTNVTDPSAAQDAATKNYVDTGLSGKQSSLGFTPVNKAGDTMSATLVLPSNGLAVGTSQLVVSGGNVGIGTSSPAQSLHVVGLITGGSQSSKSNTLDLSYNSSAAEARFKLDTASSPVQFLIGKQGIVGTGDVFFQALPLSTGYGILETWNGSGTVIGTGSTGNATPTPILFRMNRSEQMRVHTNGNIGIGTTNPTSKIQVNGDTSDSSSSPLNVANSSNQSILYVLSDARVGINTTSPNSIDVTQNNRIPSSNNAVINVYSWDNQAADTGGSIGFGGKDGSISNRNFAYIGGLKENSTSGNYAGYLSFATRANGSNNAERMRISSAGNVGIGTTNPGYPLDVVGDIRTSQCLRYNSSTLGTCSSDARLKKDIRPFDLGLDVVLGLQPKYFKYNGLGGEQESSSDQMGVIAQEVEKVAPSLVSTRWVKMRPEDKKETEIKVVNYSAFTYALINSIHEIYENLIKKADKTEFAQLQAENKRLMIEIEQLKRIQQATSEDSATLKKYLCERDPGAPICKN